MNLAHQSGPATPAEPEHDLRADDPFRIGTRFVRRTRPDGEIEVDIIPLTSEGLLFPEEEDRPAQNRSHTEDCLYVYGSFRLKFAEVPGALVLMDHQSTSTWRI